MLKTAFLILGGLTLMAVPLYAGSVLDGADCDRYNVVWQSPSRDYTGSMPLGNGEIALNAWVEENGDLLFYIARTDAWGDNGRLLKIGRVRVHVDPPIWRDGMAFAQTLRLRDATLVVHCGKGADASVLELWVDANRPMVQAAVQTSTPSTVTASIELWRTDRGELPTIEVSDVNLHRGKPGNKEAPTIVEPDTILTGLGNSIGWVHHNVKSVGPALTMQVQGLADFAAPDPLLHRTFGALIFARNGRRLDDNRLQSPNSREHVFTIPVLTRHPATIEQWIEAAKATVRQAEEIPLNVRKTQHDAWWKAFWERSWIHVTGPDEERMSDFIPANTYPLRIGRDQQGRNRFKGEIARASVWTRALDQREIAGLAQDTQEVLEANDSALVGSWASPLGAALDVSKSNLTGPLTIEAWIKPGTLPPSGGRVFDKITPGGGDGFLLDTYPGNSLRFIVAREVLLQKNILTPNRWSHVAAVVDPKLGRVCVYHNGKPVAESAMEVGNDAFIVSRAYALQRFVTACAGRGRYPIKFNGSLFTVPAEGAPGDADYRRWGPGYWWQNTRLPYISLCSAGDTEMMLTLFQMYARDLMPLFAYRTKAYFGHEGAFIPECIYFWGAVFSETYGWKPAAERTDKLQQSGYHKWEWVSGPELVWMMLDYYEHTQDKTFLRDTLLPAAHEILAFFDRHYETNAAGKLVMHPAQALETWWDCTNPMPESAGLYGCTARLLALPEALTTEDKRAFWRKLRNKLPPLPTRTENGVEMLAPATVFKSKHNIENPELYAVFPFRRIAVGRPRLDLGLEALKHRWDRGNMGWRQDDIFMAYLGQAEAAAQGLVQRARKHDAKSRFPAFWGPNYDWVPDQDHGGVLMKALQAMVLQTDGDAIYVLPAWPRRWNVHFRLHAPKRTIVQGRYENGELRDLQVTPESRRRDVVIGEMTAR